MDRKFSRYLNQKLRIWISISMLATLMVIETVGERERERKKKKVNESKRTPTAAADLGSQETHLNDMCV